MTDDPTMTPAAPAHAIGTVVSYIDHHSRPQRGEVLWVEATWRGDADTPPLIIYTVRHPTYAGRRMYVSADAIH